MQYGQRKLQRSITEMRRSRMGRASESRGAGSAFSGTRLKRGDMIQVWALGEAVANNSKLGRNPPRQGSPGTGRCRGRAYDQRCRSVTKILVGADSAPISSYWP